MEKLKNIIANSIRNRPSTPMRIVNGRGGQVPGFDNMNIDIYPPLIYITVYCEYSDEEILQIAGAVQSIFNNQPVLIQDRSVRPAVTRLKIGEIPEEMTVEENGLRFYINPFRGQNPGFFPDMRRGRARICDLVRQVEAAAPGGVNVLNLFAYTCALSVAALSAGAAKVVNIDKNRRSLDIGKRNHSLNSDRIPGGDRNRALFLPHDIFKSIGRLKKEGPYALIIADPPPSQKGSFMLKKDYPRLLKRLPEMLLPGGRLFLTLNSPRWAWDDFECMIKENLPDFTNLERISPPEDFAPCEDGRGLKIIVAALS